MFLEADRCIMYLVYSHRCSCSKYGGTINEKRMERIDSGALQSMKFCVELIIPAFDQHFPCSVMF